jgi:alkanesulfonate monooxygenase SsuD/methylene tetrahydromethanopterin reductase-like flavin-dependent oxidoreductase (luciferase family)
MVALAAEAEAAGWDGVFIADAISVGLPNAPAFPLFDPWALLAAMAVRTERIRLGTFITPVSRRRPWKLAREAVTVDHLSNGRMILCAGLGAAEHDGGFCKVGEAMDLRTRAERLDEGLDIIGELWSGRPVSFAGKHFRVEKLAMQPVPVQQPRIPVWVVGVWPKEKSMARALRWDGVIPQNYRAMQTGQMQVTAATVKEICDYAAKRRMGKSAFDVISGGMALAKKKKGEAARVVAPYAEAGATWWLENMEQLSLEKARTRIPLGPPK